ncbi:MAG: YidC/Oxa1 family membrane protein insertase, partial [Firmicutes bacterium]|nr:YidC/Oxa1 family membrane protein insertase [Bacillota bacterium]
VMPIMIGIFSLSFPSGLVLYWITSNLFSIAQQAWINKLYPSEEQGGQAK